MNPSPINPRISDLQYVLLPGKCGPDFPRPDLYESAYGLWKGLWKKVYEDAGSPASFLPDDFLRQDVICGLFHEKQAVALHLYSLFNVSSQAVLDHRYFAFYPPEYIAHLRERNSPYVMSMEFLTVHPECRKKDTGVSLGDVLCGCGVEVLKSVGAHAAVAPARKDVGAHEMARKIGFVAWQENVVKRNFVCDLMIAFRDQMHAPEDPFVRNLSTNLWERRWDFTQKTAHVPASAAA